MKAILAMDLNRLIGKGSIIPWRVKEELGFFKLMTRGDKLLMGRKTFETLPNLKEREIFVLTHETDKTKIKHNQKEDNWHIVGDKFPDDVWIAGGREIYELFLPKCDSVLVSVLNKSYDGDVFLPPFEHHFGRKQVFATFTGFVVYRYLENKNL